MNQYVSPDDEISPIIKIRKDVIDLRNDVIDVLEDLMEDFPFENTQNTRQLVVNQLKKYLGDKMDDKTVYDYAVACDETNNTTKAKDKLFADLLVKINKDDEFVFYPIMIDLADQED